MSFIRFLLVLCFAFICSCSPSSDTLESIEETGTLRVLTVNNANAYYIYRNAPMGFEYDLAKAFADYLEVDLEVITPGWDDLLGSLNKGKGDFVAAGMTVLDSREELVDFSDPYMTVQQRLIHHKNTSSYTTLNDLNGTRIHVREGTSYQVRLQELVDDGYTLEIVLHANLPTEELIRQVAEKEIGLTLADSNIAQLNRRYYPDVRLGIPTEEPQELAWAVRKGDDRFRSTMNEFLRTIRENGTYARIYERYYSGVEIFDYVDLKKYQKRLESRLPKYKPVIMKASARHGFDWRLIAAMIYQESHFNPKARSYTGVRGLMQLTLNTAGEMGIENRLDPVQSIKGGTAYLAKLYARFDQIHSDRDRMLFALASYNIGYGHVRDAQDIARDLGMDPNRWADLKEVLPLLRNPEYYKQTTYGYARGTEPVRYVDRILLYYDILKQRSVA